MRAMIVVVAALALAGVGCAEDKDNTNTTTGSLQNYQKGCSGDDECASGLCAASNSTTFCAPNQCQDVEPGAPCGEGLAQLPQGLGYECSSVGEQLVCVQTCRDSADCPTGLACDGAYCTADAASAPQGKLADYQVGCGQEDECESGVCVVDTDPGFCAPDCGDSPAGTSCGDRGVCVSLSTSVACLLDCTVEDVCPEGLTCDGTHCRMGGSTSPNQCTPPGTSEPAPVSLTGASFDAQDAVALIRHSENPAAEPGDPRYTSQLHIRLTRHENACALEDGLLFLKGQEFVEVSLKIGSDTQFVEFTAGTYAYSQPSELTFGTTYFTGVNYISDCGEACALCSGGGGGGGPLPTGSVEITEITETSVTGTFTYSSDSANYSGSFTAPICGGTDPEPTYCCYAP